MRKLTWIFPVFLLASALYNPAETRAQGMISYGHGVAKAGAAGSAVGAGAVGVFRKLGRPLDQAEKAGASTARPRRPAPRAEDVRWDIGGPSGGSKSSLKLNGGVQAAGVSAPNWTPALVEASENVAVLTAEWSGGPEPEPEVAPEPDLAAASATQADSQADQAGGALIVASDHAASGARSSSAAVQTGKPAHKLAFNVPVEAGMSLDEVFDKLGDPKLSFVGVAGEGYTDQFVFELEDGRRLIVYALEGLVSRVDVSE